MSIPKDLIKAARLGHTETVELLLHYVANVYALDNAALREASGRGHPKVVNLLNQYYLGE